MTGQGYFPFREAVSSILLCVNIFMHSNILNNFPAKNALKIQQFLLFMQVTQKSIA